MVSEEDLIEIVAEEICKESPRKGKWGFFVKEPYNKCYSTLTSKRKFFSEWEIKNMLRENKKSLTLPHGAIVSPLAEEWLKEKGIELIFAPPH